MKEKEKGTDGVNEQDVFFIKQKYFGLKIPIGHIADDFGYRISQVMRAVQLNETTDIKFTCADFATSRWTLRKG